MRKKQTVRKIGVTGKTDTYYVTLPKESIRDLKWRKGQKVVIEQIGDKLVIKDWTPG